MSHEFWLGIVLGFGCGYAVCLWLAIWAGFIGRRERGRHGGR